MKFQSSSRFAVAKSLELAGVGTRTKAGIVKVYSVGFYAATSALSSCKGKSSDCLKTAKGPKAALLTFTMGVDEEKVATALSGVSGVKTEIVEGFKALLVQGMGGKMQKGEQLTLEWDGPSVTVTVRGKYAGKIKDRALGDGLLDLYLGKAAVSPTLKEDIRAALAAAA